MVFVTLARKGMIIFVPWIVLLVSLIRVLFVMLLIILRAINIWSLLRGVWLIVKWILVWLFLLEFRILGI
ncbi:hypothetical protein D6745_01040 [Candidatus Woesearchaeota archaeon]|nr:MAG: hypothetical protein D6745_01040 [Candidatus Woesearchaeota archaeon]